MLRRLGYWLLAGMAAAGLVAVAWPDGPAGPVTLLRRIDVIAIVAILAALPSVTRRSFGPVGDGWLPRAVRVGGYLSVCGLVLVKAEASRFEYGGFSRGSWLVGLWLGEIIFLVVMAGYVAVLLAVTARRPPVRRATLVIGIAAGASAGLVVAALPSAGGTTDVTSAWLTVLHGGIRLLAIPIVLCATATAGLVAARRVSAGTGKASRADMRARQGVAAGLCAGIVAALAISLAGIVSTALLPKHRPFDAIIHNRHIPRSWFRFELCQCGPLRNFSIQNTPPGLHELELSVGASAAGYLLVLVCVPLLGAGLGAWGGICAAGRLPGRPGGGGGGEGPDDRPVVPPPPPGGLRLELNGQPAILRGYLLELPTLPDRVAGDEPVSPGRG
jgi:hypothetical protein